MKHAAFKAAADTLAGKDVIVSFSGGKDSLVILDIASRVARRVEAFFMELVPHLDVMEPRIAAAEERWNVKIRRYPHWLRQTFRREGVYTFHSQDISRLDINDIYAVVRAETGIRLIVTGAKRGDSLWRRRTGKVKFAKDDLKAPLWDWSTRDVFGYLKARDIPLPENDGRNASGIDLTWECVQWLYDKHPESYRQVEEAFPFCGALIKRREYYGI